MLKYEVILIDPSPGEIAERLGDAAAAANKRCRTRLLADDPAKWRKFARQVQAGPEGFDLFRGGKGGVPGTQVVAAWWTDTIGRKHVAVRGRRIEHDDAKILLQRDALARRPPLWHCYPQHVYQRFVPTAGEPQADWIAVCGCGAVGTPAALGWMGDVCGPCHDRREDFGADALRDNRPGWLPGVRNPFVAVAFGRGGTKLAGVEERGPVSVWDLAAGGPAQVLPFDSSHASLLFVGAADETVLVCDELDFGTFVFAPGDPARNGFWRRGMRPDLHLWPTPDPDRVVSVFNGTLEPLTFPARVAGRPFVTDGQIWVRPATSPAPRFLPIIETEGVRVLDSLPLAEVAFAPYRATGRPEAGIYQRHYAAYHEPTRTVFVAWYSEIDAYDVSARAHRPPVVLSRLPAVAFQNRWPAISSIALSADDRHLFVAAGERLAVFDAVTRELVAAFAWHLGPIACLAVSPDGRTLATAGVEGVVKLWPIDRLLGST